MSTGIVRTTVEVKVYGDDGSCIAVVARNADVTLESTDITGTYRKALETAAAHVDIMLVGGFGESHAVRHASHAQKVKALLHDEPRG